MKRGISNGSTTSKPTTTSSLSSPSVTSKVTSKRKEVPTKTTTPKQTIQTSKSNTKLQRKDIEEEDVVVGEEDIPTVSFGDILKQQETSKATPKSNTALKASSALLLSKLMAKSKQQQPKQQQPKQQQQVKQQQDESDEMDDDDDQEEVSSSRPTNFISKKKSTPMSKVKLNRTTKMETKTSDIVTFDDSDDDKVEEDQVDTNNKASMKTQEESDSEPEFQYKFSSTGVDNSDSSDNSDSEMGEQEQEEQEEEEAKVVNEIHSKKDIEDERENPMEDILSDYFNVNYKLKPTKSLRAIEKQRKKMDREQDIENGVEREKTKEPIDDSKVDVSKLNKNQKKNYFKRLREKEELEFLQSISGKQDEEEVTSILTTPTEPITPKRFENEVLYQDDYIVQPKKVYSKYTKFDNTPAPEPQQPKKPVEKAVTYEDNYEDVLSSYDRNGKRGSEKPTTTRTNYKSNQKPIEPTTQHQQKPIKQPIQPTKESKESKIQPTFKDTGKFSFEDQYSASSSPNSKYNKFNQEKRGGRGYQSQDASQYQNKQNNNNKFNNNNMKNNKQDNNRDDVKPDQYVEKRVITKQASKLTVEGNNNNNKKPTAITKNETTKTTTTPKVELKRNKDNNNGFNFDNNDDGNDFEITVKPTTEPVVEKKDYVVERVQTPDTNNGNKSNKGLSGIKALVQNKRQKNTWD